MKLTTIQYGGTAKQRHNMHFLLVFVACLGLRAMFARHGSVLFLFNLFLIYFLLTF